jgi:hypothetical protein
MSQNKQLDIFGELTAPAPEQQPELRSPARFGIRARA